MDFIPVKLIYIANIQGHDLNVTVQYFKAHKSFDFYFQDKKISSKIIKSEGEALYQKDDVIIDEMIKEYCKNNKGLFTDIFSKHADKVRLKSKEVDAIIREGFIEMNVNFIVKKSLYSITACTNDKSGKFSCQLKADSFSEVLEKLRLFSGVLGSSNAKLGTYIDSFSHDEIKDNFQWYDGE